MKVILKRDEFNELSKEYEIHHIEQDKYGNKRIYLNQHRWVAPSLVEKYIEGDIMKITIYELLGKMKDFEAPNKIIYDTKLWTYNGNDYEDENNWELFDEYVLLDILNDEVTILETTITYKQDEPIFKKIDGKWYVRKDFKPNDNIIFVEKEKQDDKIEKLSYQQIGSWALEQHNWIDYARAVDKQIQQIGSKINEIIDYINKD